MEVQTQIILDSIADGVFTVDSEWRITSFNRAAEKITGIKKGDALGRHCWDVFRASICEKECALRQTMETGHQVIDKSIYIVNSDGDRIPVSISTAVLKDNEGLMIGGAETFRDLSLLEALRKELSARHSFHDIISKDKEMLRLFSMLEQISESDSTVLIEGESGTGKELFAKAIHFLSRRNKGPMITVNCGSLPDSLLESELFGYKAGAFTDAKKDKPGRLALAKGGTLFLDEIGDITPALQVRLLRVLQDKTYEPLGGTKSEKANVRIVTATNKDLTNLVKTGSFREDLYYRVNVVKIKLPPLRDRKGDIPLLIDHFIKKYSHLNSKEVQGVTSEVLHILMSHRFDGNIRELENIIEYAIVVCKEKLISTKYLPDYLCQKPGVEEKVLSNEKTLEPGSLDEIEKKFILDVLHKNNYNRKLTATQLDMHPATLWRKIKRFNLDIPKIDGRAKKT